MSSMLSAAPLSKEQLGAMLLNILHGTDNNERRAIEAQLISSLSDPTNLFSLVHLLMDQGNVPTGVRHLAAVLLRKRILTLWKALDEPTKVEIKALFLQQLGNEESKVVRFAIAHIVTRIAKVGWDGGDDGEKNAGWPELVQAIRVAADDPRPAMRELSMVLLFSVCEVFSDANALTSLAAETVVRGVMDEEEVVCRAAIKAGMTLLPCLCGKVALRREFLSHLIPQCIAQLTRYCTLKEKVGLCVMFLDLLEECLEELSTAKQAALLTTLIQAVLDLLLHRGVHLLIRENCGSFLGKVVQKKKPKFVISHGFLPLFVRAGGQLMAEDASVGTLDSDVIKNNRIIGEGEGDEDTFTGNVERSDAMDGEDFDDDEEVDMLNAQNACMIGRQLLSALSSSLSSKTFTHEVMAMVNELKLLVSEAPSTALSGVAIPIPSISPSSSSSCYPYPKKSIIFTLASLSESNPGYLRRRVGEIVQLTEEYLIDPDPITREAVSASLPWFCMHLQPEIITHHQRLFPILIPLLEDKTDRVRRQAALALEVLCEHTADHLEPYIHPLVHTILLHLSTSSLPTQKNMCSVLSSIAASKTQSFQPFAPQVLELLLQAVQMTAPNALPLRARAVETVGVVAVSMGKEAFLPYLPHFIGHVVDNFKQEDPLLREYSFGFLCNVCEMLQQDFLPYMEDTIQCAIHTIEQDRSIYKNKHLLTKDAPSLGQFSSRPFRLPEEHELQTKNSHYDPASGTAMTSTSSPFSGGGEEVEVNTESDEEGSEEEIHMRVRTADVEEKSAAVYAIGVVAKVMQEAMGDERLTICWETLAALDEHFYPEIRANALIALGKLATAAHGSGGVVVKTFSNDTLRAFTRRLVDTLLYQMLLPCIENEQEKDVVLAALETLTSLLQYFGPQCLLFGPDDVIRDCIQLMRVKMPCQKDDVEESEVEDSGEEELDDGAEKGKNGDAKEKKEENGMAMFDTDDLVVGSETNVASWTTSLDPSRILQNVTLPEDHDDELMDGAMDALEAVFEVYQEQAIPYARYVIPLLLLYADPSVRPSEDVIMAVGTFACLLQSMGAAACENYFETAMQVAAGVMQHSEESSARSNAAYTLKVLLENCPERFSPENGAYLLQTMELLWTIVSAGTETSSSGEIENGACDTDGKGKEEIPEAVDNAVSATCSLVRCLPSCILPLETILPVLFSHLPMRVDQTENKNAVHTLVYLYASPSTQRLLQEQATSPTWLPAFFQATLSMLQSRTVAAEEKNNLAAEGVQVFMTNYPSLWMQAPGDLQNLISQWQASSSVP